MMKLPFAMGTELTGIHKRFNGHNMYDWDLNDRYLEEIRQELVAAGVKYHGQHTDDHCIEISSKKLYTTEEYKKFSITVRRILAKHFFVPKNPHAVCGGGHIHVGITNKKLKYEIARDLIMRPYLPWVFGEPDEEGSMDCILIKAKNMEEFLIKEVLHEYSFGYWYERILLTLMKPYDSNTNYCDLLDNKEDMFRLSSFGTVEFRFFEMTPTWEEQELHLQFVIAYLNWITARVKNGNTSTLKIRPMKEEALQLVTPVEAIAQFEELCYDLGLEFDNYQPFIKRNLLPRWKNGRKRL